MISGGGERLSDLLDFYVEAGVDAVVGEQPVDRFAVETSLPPPERERKAAAGRRL